MAPFIRSKGGAFPRLTLEHSVLGGCLVDDAPIRRRGVTRFSLIIQMQLFPPLLFVRGSLIQP